MVASERQRVESEPEGFRLSNTPVFGRVPTKEPDSEGFNAWEEEYKLQNPDDWGRLQDCSAVSAERIVSILRCKPPGWKRAFGGLGDDWGDSCLLRIGLFGWDIFRGSRPGTSLEIACRVARRSVQELYGGTLLRHRDGDPAVLETKAFNALMFADFAVRWADEAFQKVVTSHTFAAALMCSDASRETLASVRLPWKAFMIVVPNGLLSLAATPTRSAIDIDRVLVAVEAEGRASLIAYASQAEGGWRGAAMFTSAGSLASLLEDADGTIETTATSNVTNEDVDGRYVRLGRLIPRLVVGLLLAMQRQDNFRTKVTPARVCRKTRKVLEPAHRTTIVGQPVGIDCRAQIMTFLNGESEARGGGPISVQTLVRGHYRRQVVGVGGGERRILWIEPYWRGDEEAPILTRPKIVE